MQWIDRLLGKKAKAPTAADIAGLIAAAETERRDRLAKLDALNEQKAVALVDADAAALDRIEAAAAVEMRALDVADARLPILRTRHAELMAAENAAAIAAAKAAYRAELLELVNVLAEAAGAAQRVHDLGVRLRDTCPVPGALDDLPVARPGRITPEAVQYWVDAVTAWADPRPATLPDDSVLVRFERPATPYGQGETAAVPLGEAALLTVHGVAVPVDTAALARLPDVVVTAGRDAVILGSRRRAGEEIQVRPRDAVAAIPQEPPEILFRHTVRVAA